MSPQPRLWMLSALTSIALIAGCSPAAGPGTAVAVPAAPTPAEQELMRRVAGLEETVGDLEDQSRRMHAELGTQLDAIQTQLATLGVKLSAQDRLLSRAAAQIRSSAPTEGGPQPPAPVQLDGADVACPLGTTPPVGEAAVAGLQAADPPAESGSAAPEATDLEELRAIGEVGSLIPEPPEEGQRRYETAFRDLQRENYQLALLNFREFLQAYPQTRLSDNAQYWVGEAFYAQGQFHQAIEEFRKVVDEYPGQDKVPGAHYKIALCFINLRDTVTARRYLDYVIEHYPESREAELAREKLAGL